MALLVVLFFAAVPAVFADVALVLLPVEEAAGLLGAAGAAVEEDPPVKKFFTPVATDFAALEILLAALLTKDFKLWPLGAMKFMAIIRVNIEFGQGKIYAD